MRTENKTTLSSDISVFFFFLGGLYEWSKNISHNNIFSHMRGVREMREKCGRKKREKKIFFLAGSYLHKSELKVIKL